MEAVYWVGQKFVPVFPFRLTENPNELFDQLTTMIGQRVQVGRGLHCAALVLASQRMQTGPCGPAGGILWVFRCDKGPLYPRMARPGAAGATPCRAGSPGIQERTEFVFKSIHPP